EDLGVGGGRVERARRARDLVLDPVLLDLDADAEVGRGRDLCERLREGLPRPERGRAGRERRLLPVDEAGAAVRAVGPVDARAVEDHLAPASGAQDDGADLAEPPAAAVVGDALGLGAPPTERVGVGHVAAGWRGAGGRAPWRRGGARGGAGRPRVAGTARPIRGRGRARLSPERLWTPIQPNARAAARGWSSRLPWSPAPPPASGPENSRRSRRRGL